MGVRHERNPNDLQEEAQSYRQYFEKKNDNIEQFNENGGYA